MQLPLDPSTGYTSTTINAANIQNKGIELALDVNVPLPGEFSWNIRGNYTKNISRVKSIIEGIDRVQIGAQDFIRAGIPDYGNYAIPSKQYGVFYGKQIKKDDDGNFIVNGRGKISGTEMNLL